MARYTIKASVAVAVEMSIEASSEDAARDIFTDNLIMTAGLIDTSKTDFDVNDDSIEEICSLTSELEPA